MLSGKTKLYGDGLNIKGNKVYSPETCCFIPKEINLLILKPKMKTRDLPIGIQKWGHKYRVKLRINNKQKHIGVFETINKAFIAYKFYKESHIKSMADKYENRVNKAIYSALVGYSVDYN